MDEALKLSLKRDPQVLYDALGLGTIQGNPEKMHRCVFHQEKSASLHTSCGRDGLWFFKCFGAGCEKKGDFIAARMLLTNKSYREVCAEYTSGEYKPVRSRPRMPMPPPQRTPRRPVLDKDRACSFILKSQEILARDFTKIEERFPRGVSLRTCEHYGLGFRWGFRLRETRSSELPAAWVFPVLRTDGKLGGVKMHFEKTPARDKKSLWWFGTVPKDKPSHAFNTFWPAPEWEAAPWITHSKRRIWICPGELKAFAAISCGFNATAWTGGESVDWEKESIHVRRFAGRDVTVSWDDDDAGIAWREKILNALYPFANSLTTQTFGKLHDGTGKRDWCDAAGGR